jgi:hypothetical protein
MPVMAGDTYNALYTLLSVYMPKAASKSLVNRWSSIMRNRGIEGLFAEIKAQTKSLETLIPLSRTERIALVNTGKSPLSGMYVWFHRIAVRAGKKGGFSLAWNLLAIQGWFKHAPAKKEDYLEAARTLLKKESPFLPSDGPYLHESDLDKIRLYVPNQRSWWITQKARSLEYEFDLPYPFSHKMVTILDERIPGFEITPSDLIRSLDAFPKLALKYYSLFQDYLFGDMMPSREHLQKVAQSVTVEVGGTGALLNKDRKNKLRLVTEVTWVLQFLMHPLRKVLKQMLMWHPSSHIEDQEAGIREAERLLNEGPVTSIDISKFSDNIPAELQFHILQLTLPAHPLKEVLISLYYDICRLSFLTPYRGVLFKHVLGGPMGLESNYDSSSWTLIQLMSAVMPLNRFTSVGDDYSYDSRFDNKVQHVFTVFGIPWSESKTIWASDHIVEFCGRQIVKEGRLDTYKANVLDDTNPMPSLLRFGAAVLDLMPRIRPRDRIYLQLLPLMQRQEVWLRLFEPSYRDLRLAPGGYSPSQLYKMGYLSQKQFYVLRFLVCIIFSKADLTPEEFLDLKLPKYASSKGKKQGSRSFYTIPVRAQMTILELRPAVVLDEADQERSDGFLLSPKSPFMITDLQALFELWVHVLNDQVISGHLNARPGRNQLGMVQYSSLLTNLQNQSKDRGVSFPQHHPELDDADSRARSHLAPLGMDLLSKSDRKHSPSSQIEVNLDSLYPPPLEVDVKTSKSLLDRLYKFFSTIKNKVIRRRFRK